jgi:hypothetical protein
MLRNSYLCIAVLALLGSLTGCNGGGGSGASTDTATNPTASTPTSSTISVSNIAVDSNGTLNITGNGLLSITSLQIISSTNQTTNLALGSNLSDTQITTNALVAFSIIANQIYSLVLSSAQGATTYPITFTIPNNSITNANLQSGAVSIANISSTGTPSSATFLRGDGVWATPSSSSSSGGRTSCPAGYTLIGTAGDLSAFCFSTSRETDYAGSSVGSYYTAMTSCNSKSPQARLCTVSQWTSACLSYSSFSGGLSNFTTTWIAGPPSGANTNYMGPSTTGANNSACMVGGLSANTTNLFWRCCL